jgi:hypothetical protein
MTPDPRLEQVATLLSAVIADARAGLTDEDLCLLTSSLEGVGRLVDAGRAFAAAEVVERSRFELGDTGLAQRNGMVRGEHLIEQIARVSPAEVARRVRLGLAVESMVSLTGELLPARFPFVESALFAGKLGVDSASAIIRCLQQAAAATTSAATPSDFALAEETLVAVAATEPAEIVAVHARVWRERLHPDGAKPREDVLHAQRNGKIGRERNGMTPVHLEVPTADIGFVREIVNEHLSPRIEIPRFMSEVDRAAAEAAGVTDLRSRGQKTYDIFLGTLKAGSRTNVGSMRPAATVMAVITLEDLRNGTGVGWLDDVAEPVSAQTIQQMACDSGYATILLGDQGEVLHLGLVERFFSTAQRKALAVRDGGCVWPGCHAPPSWCDAHHVQFYEHDGPTDISNGALLCGAHHRMLHHEDYTMRMRDGKPELLAPKWIDPDQQWRPIGRTRALMASLLVE